MTHKINWQTTVLDLKSSGWTETKLAALCGCTQANINLMAQGLSKNPRYSIGAPLVELHKSMLAVRRRTSQAA